MSNITVERISNGVGTRHTAYLFGDYYCGEAYLTPFPGYCGGGVVHNAYSPIPDAHEVLNHLFAIIEDEALSVGKCELFYVLAYRSGEIYGTSPGVKTILEERGWEIVHRGETTKYTDPAETVYYKKQLVVPPDQRRQL